MENAEKEIFWFLNKNYYIKEQKFFDKRNNSHEWGFDISNLVSNVFSYSLEKSQEVLTKWAYQNDLSDDAFFLAFGKQKLKVKWSTEMAMDLQAYGITSAEEQLTKLLIDEIVKEIDAQILIDLREEIKTANDLLGVLKCLGYESTEIVYDPQTFSPQKRFVSTKYHEMMDERQNNPFWLKWSR